MPQIINTNIASLTAQRNLNKSQGSYQTALQRLSSGLRINSAADDAAGLAIVNRFQAQVNGTNQAIKNAGDGISLAQTAGSALSSITDNLQRIRELAVQSANDTNTTVDRQSLQQEVNQLKQEIQNTATTTNFNGKNLLDGTFQNAQFQVGANVGQTISVSLNKVDTSTLGTAQSAGLSGQLSKAEAAGLTSSSTDTLSAQDFSINGVAVGASSGSSDTASTAHQSDSAIAKAAAINAVSSQSGVTATADATVATGTDITSITAATSFSVTINGQQLTLSAGAASTVSDVKTQLQNVADTINSKQGATGVSASVVQTNDGYRIDLTAQDGRNIQVVSTTTDASKLGLAGSTTNSAGTTYVGTVTLNSTDGSNITLATSNGNIDNAGFEAGTYSGVNGGAVANSEAIGASSGTGSRYQLSSGDLLINGIDVGATQASADTASTSDNAASAIALAAAINNVSGQTGVSAQANANTVYSGTIGTAASSFSVTINGVAISGSTTTDQASNQTAIIDAINAKSGQTGVTAQAVGSDKFELVASDGRNISVKSATAATALSTTDTVYAGSVSLQSAGQFTLGSLDGNIANSGFQVGTYGGSQTGTKLENLDISTVSGANAAIKAVDNALQTINSNQGTLGAIQNRFTSTVSNLQSLSDNLTSAQSRIQDADFAAETAKLSKAQVLQQAGISILAQANAQPKQVLSLLQ